jgi:AraC-like DNA-binding protein
MLRISRKALNKRITRHGKIPPNDLIKNRIVEAKRLLVHTPLCIKATGYKLGYDDTSHFTRFFSK